jgi:DNA-binding transcriptional MerR regulator
MNVMGVFAKEVSLHLEVSPNTLRRWCLELEKHHYVFERNEKDQRIFYERDILALSDLQRLLGKGQSMDNATKAIVARKNDKENAEKTLSVIHQGTPNSSELITFTKEEFKQLTEHLANEVASRTAEHILAKFNDTIEKRDHRLMEVLKENQQARIEQAAASQKEKGFFKKLFSKAGGLK